MVEENNQSLWSDVFVAAAAFATATAEKKRATHGNNNHNHEEHENENDESFQDDSTFNTFDKLLWSNSPEEDYLNHIINEHSSNNNNNNTGTDAEEEEKKAKLLSANRRCKAMDSISLREQEKEVGTVKVTAGLPRPPSSSSARSITSKKSMGSHQISLLTGTTTYEQLYDKEVTGTLNMIRKSASSYDNPTKPEEIEVLFHMNNSSASNSYQQQLDVEEGGGGGGGNNHNYKINHRPRQISTSTSTSNSTSNSTQYSASVNLNLPSLTTNRNTAPASPPKINRESKSAPGTPSTVIIENHHLDNDDPSDIEDSVVPSNVGGSSEKGSKNGGSSNSNSDVSGFDDDDDGGNSGDGDGCSSSNSQSTKSISSSYSDVFFGFLQRASHNNKLYRRAILLVISLLLLFVILIIVALVQVDGNRESSSLSPPSSSASITTTTGLDSTSAEYDDAGFGSDFDLMSELFGGQDEDLDQGDVDVVSSPSTDTDTDTDTDRQEGPSVAPDPAMTKPTPTPPPTGPVSLPSYYDVDDDDGIISLSEENPSHQTLPDEDDTLPIPPNTSTSITTGTTAPPGENITMGDQLLQVIRKRLPDTIPALVNDPSSPQSRAYDWAVNLYPPTPQELASNPMRLVQRYVLAVLYYMTNGPDWTESTGWLDPNTRDECTWHETGSGAGKTVVEEQQRQYTMCDEFGRIETINLRKNNLSGPFPTELVLLSDTLKHLRFNGNKLIGTIPSTIFDGSSGSYMTKLQRFHLHWNAMTGTIPNIVGTTNNLDEGKGNGLPNLLSLRLGHNHFVGSIPWQLSGLSNLERLDMAANQLQGGIPFLLMDLSTLTELNLSANNLLGSIPSEITNLQALRTLELDGNHFTGTLPMGMLSDLSNLERFDLSKNDLSGVLPVVGALSALTYLDLSDNNFAGSIPIDIPNKLNALTTLELDDNRFTGSIPFGLCSKIKLPSMEKLLLDCETVAGCWCCDDCQVDVVVGGSMNPASGSLAKNVISASASSLTPP